MKQLIMILSIFLLAVPIAFAAIQIAGLIIPKNKIIGWSIAAGIVIIGLLIYQFIFREKSKGKKKYKIILVGNKK